MLARAVQDRAATVADPADAARHDARISAAAGNALQRTLDDAPWEFDPGSLEDRVTRLENMWRVREGPHTQPLPFTPADERVMELMTEAFERNREGHESDRAQLYEANRGLLWLRETERDKRLRDGLPVSPPKGHTPWTTMDEERSLKDSW